MEDFRGMLARLEAQGDLVRCQHPVDLRYVAAMWRKAEKILLFERVKGYDIPVVGGLFWNRHRTAACLNWPHRELGSRLLEGLQRPVEPVVVDEGPCQEVVHTGAAVDLTMLPLPTLHERDGGPYISASVSITRDPETGALNAGCYRFMLRGRQQMTINMVTASDQRSIYEHAFQRGEPLPMAVAVGLHAYDQLGAAIRAPKGLSEFAVAGGLYGAPVEMVKCKTIDLCVPAHAEIVLEGELLPVGWKYDEGPFGEFAGMQGEVKYDPIFRVTAVTHRRNPIFYSLQMPWENDWLVGPSTEASCLRLLRDAGLQVTAIRVTEGGHCAWQVIASIKKRAGEAKNALLALLSQANVKMAVVTDPDVDIYDPEDVDRAVTFRCQPDQDVIIVGGAKAIHIDPSVRPWELKPGQLPMTAKMGIDATISEGIPPQRYEKLKQVYLDAVDVPAFLANGTLPAGGTAPGTTAAVAERITALLRERPHYFHELLARIDADYRSIVTAWAEVRQQHEMKRSDSGHYSL